MQRLPLKLLLPIVGVIAICACGWFAIKPILGTCANGRPGSISNPPILPGAQQIDYGKSSFEPHQGYAGKLTQFQTTEIPKTVYDFYRTSLSNDGWIEYGNPITEADPNPVEVQFNWQCTGMSSVQQIASLWLHTERIDAGKTIVTLNYEYVP